MKNVVRYDNEEYSFPFETKEFLFKSWGLLVAIDEDGNEIGDVLDIVDWEFQPYCDPCSDVYITMDEMQHYEFEFERFIQEEFVDRYLGEDDPFASYDEDWEELDSAWIDD